MARLTQEELDNATMALAGDGEDMIVMDIGGVHYKIEEDLDDPGNVVAFDSEGHPVGRFTLSGSPSAPAFTLVD